MHSILWGFSKQIMEAVAKVRETITFVDPMKLSLCVLSLDFKNPFDGVSNK